MEAIIGKREAQLNIPEEIDWKKAAADFAKIHVGADVLAYAAGIPGLYEETDNIQQSERR